MTRRVTVRLAFEIEVVLPLPIPDRALIGTGPDLRSDSGYHDAAVSAALGCVARRTEIDVSGVLGIPFHLDTVGPEHQSSMARVTADIDEEAAIAVYVAEEEPAP